MISAQTAGARADASTEQHTACCMACWGAPELSSLVSGLRLVSRRVVSRSRRMCQAVLLFVTAFTRSLNKAAYSPIRARPWCVWTDARTAPPGPAHTELPITVPHSRPWCVDRRTAPPGPYRLPYPIRAIRPPRRADATRFHAPHDFRFYRIPFHAIRDTTISRTVRYAYRYTLVVTEARV